MLIHKCKYTFPSFSRPLKWCNHAHNNQNTHITSTIQVDMHFPLAPELTIVFPDLHHITFQYCFIFSTITTDIARKLHLDTKTYSTYGLELYVWRSKAQDSGFRPRYLRVELLMYITSGRQEFTLYKGINLKVFGVRYAPTSISID